MRRITNAWVLAPVLAIGLGSAALADGWFGWWSKDSPTFPSSRKRYYGGKEWPLASRPGGEDEPFVHQYHTQHYWPDPYRWQDRCHVRSVLSEQVSRGWVTATTLYDQHFDPETNELNLAGKQRLRWILLHAPMNRRQTWVQIGEHQTASQIRLTSVQIAAMDIAGPDCQPPMLRVCEPMGQSGLEAEALRRRYLETAPDPRLPYVPLINGESGSSSSGDSSSGM